MVTPKLIDSELKQIITEKKTLINFPRLGIPVLAQWKQI